MSRRTKAIPYIAYWNAKGEYGMIRVQRMLLRNQKRSEKPRGSCRHSGSCHNKPEHWHSCPFQSEMNNNYDPHYCRCCNSCQRDCAMDV